MNARFKQLYQIPLYLKVKEGNFTNALTYTPAATFPFPCAGVWALGKKGKGARGRSVSRACAHVFNFYTLAGDCLRREAAA